MNVISSSVNSKSIKGHSAIMKKEVCDIFIDKFTRKGDIVLDPFFGTGTTGVCCVEKGRKYIGFEIAREYVQLAENRIREAEERVRYVQTTIFDEL